MKKLLRPTTFALLTMALCFTACENGNNSYPKEYLGFEKKAQDFSYQKNAEETELQVKIVAADKTSEDRIVFIESPARPTKPGSSSAPFYKIKDNKLCIDFKDKNAIDKCYEYNFEGKKLVIRDINNNVFNLQKNNLKN